MGAAMPELLGNVRHRGEQAQAHLSIVRARDLVVRIRTMAVQQVRGICKAFGMRLPSSTTGGFTARVAELIPELLQPALSPILALVTELTAKIRAFDKSLAGIAKDHYPEVNHLQQVDGVGPTISVAFVLSMEDPQRFRSSRSVGSWLGLCPRSQASGDSNPQLCISKAGDPRLRRLLVQGAHRIIGPLGADCDLRRYGLRLAARGGKAPKKRAAVAVARKLAILLHRLWLTGADYDALRNANRTAWEGRFAPYAASGRGSLFRLPRGPFSSCRCHEGTDMPTGRQSAAACRDTGPPRSSGAQGRLVAPGKLSDRPESTMPQAPTGALPGTGGCVR